MWGDAIARETQIKKWRREKKVALIEERNPTWEDLAEGWGLGGGDDGVRESRFLIGPTAQFGMTNAKADSSPGVAPGSE
jgi:hypothetical protein